MILYGFWRSLAAYRVRVALHMKGQDFKENSVNLLSGEQHQPEYRAVNAQGVVPSLVIDDGQTPPLTQSMAIMEYLDEVFPNPPLLPADPVGRARVRALAHISVSDGHPLVVPRVRVYLDKKLQLDEATRNEWLAHFTSEALKTYEARLSRESATGRFCHGDQPGLADICLASQAVGAGFFGVSIQQFPTVTAIFDRLMALPAFESSLPKHQPGAPS